MLTIEVQNDTDVRTALSLAAATGTPTRLLGVGGAGGAVRRHLAWARAAAGICAAFVDAEIGGGEIAFRPRAVVTGEVQCAVGMGHSAIDLVRVILPAFLRRPGALSVHASGATHVPGSQGAGWLARSVIPRLAPYGGDLRVENDATGFAPAGGGRVRVEAGVAPARESAVSRARVLLGHLPDAIGERETAALREAFPGLEVTVVSVPSRSPGNAIELELRDGARWEIFGACGRRGLSGTRLVEGLVDRASSWVASGAEVTSETAEALVPLLAVLGGGSFTVDRCSDRLVADARLAEKYLPVEVGLVAKDEMYALEVRP